MRIQSQSRNLTKLLLCLLLASVIFVNSPPARGVVSSATSSQSNYTWPTGGEVSVLEPFSAPAVAWGSGHRGVDLAYPAGNTVYAAAEGVVVFAGVVVDRPVVSIDHPDGIRTTYEPVTATVQAGQHVARGEPIGTLAASHRDDGTDALHWGARVGKKEYLNPLLLLEEKTIRLKPW